MFNVCQVVSISSTLDFILLYKLNKSLLNEKVKLLSHHICCLTYKDFVCVKVFYISNVTDVNAMHRDFTREGETAGKYTSVTLNRK